MKVLHLTLDLPYPPRRGAQTRDHALITRVAIHHEVNVVAFCETIANADDIGAMRGLCRSVDVIYRPPMTTASFAVHAAHQVVLGLPLATAMYVFPNVMQLLRRRLSEDRIDLLQIEHSFLAPYRLAAQGSGAPRTILSLHNVGAVQYERIARLSGSAAHRLLNAMKSALMQGWEAQWCDRFDSVVVVSDDEAQALRRLGVRSPIAVIPNGVDATAPPLPLPAASRRVLFVGNLRYAPNVDAVRYFAREVLPVIRAADPDIRFVIAGFDPPCDLLAGIRSEGMEVVPSPTDLRPLYAQAAVAVAPLRAGGGTRIKILEALAFGRPVVCSTIGGEGLGLHHGENALIADTPEDFATSVLSLLRDPAQAQFLAKHGRALAERFDWSLQAERLLRLYERVTS
jgi:polysaccharide biosynthesis protein PslH